MALPVTITGISTAVAPVGPFKVAAGTYDAVAINQTISFASVITLTGTGATVALGLKLTNAASSATISSVAVLTGKTGSPTDAHWIEITQTDPTGTVLATSNQILGSAITANSTVLWIFPTPATISASATFGIVFRRAAADAANYTSFAIGTNSGGSTAVSYQYGTSWSATGSPWALVVNKQTTIASDAYYFFGRNGTTATTLSAFKSTAPDTSWSSIATRTGFTTAILNLSACQSGKDIHILVQDGTMSSSVATKYVSFDASNDTFLASTETILAASAITGQATTGWGGSITVRSSGEAVAFYNVLQTNTSGTARARLSYSRRTGVNTWAAAVRVDANTAVDNINPIVVRGASDRLHFLWLAANVNQRHLTSANVLGTASAVTAATTAPLDVASFDDAGTIRHVGFTASQAMRWASADNPTITAAGVTFGTPVRTIDDNLIVYALYQNSADSDIYIRSSSDDGATFGSATNVFTGTVAAVDANLSKNQTAYQRSGVVFPYIVNDNGTLKYNEYTVRSLGAAGTGTPAAQASDTDGVGVSSSSGSGTPASQTSAVSGQGTASSAGATGAGILVAQTSAASGAGVSLSAGLGVLAAQAAAAAGVGLSVSAGAGVLVAQSSAASGAGVSASVGSGTPSAQAVAVAGSGAAASSGVGALVSDVATVSGAGVSSSTGTGSAVAGTAAVAGAGTAAAANSGALVAQDAAVAGDGVSSSIGIGTVAAGAATIAGAGLSGSTGSGVLACSPVTVAGVGVVLEEGAVTGVGALVAGAATISGEGEVSGEVAPPVEGGGGFYLGPRLLPLEPVKGVGALVANASTITGTGVSSSGGVGAIAAAASTTTGASLAVSTGSGVLECSVVTIKGEGKVDDDELAIVAWLLAA